MGICKLDSKNVKLLMACLEVAGFILFYWPHPKATLPTTSDQYSPTERYTHKTGLIHRESFIDRTKHIDWDFHSFFCFLEIRTSEARNCLGPWATCHKNRVFCPEFQCKVDKIEPRFPVNCATINYFRHLLSFFSFPFQLYATLSHIQN